MQNETKIFPPKEVAMEFKRVGFNEPCVGWYDNNQEYDCAKPNIDEEYTINSSFIPPYSDDACTAPTYDQVIGWFADVHGIFIESSIGFKGMYYASIFNKIGMIERMCEYSADRQQSLLTAFREAIKLIEK